MKLLLPLPLLPLPLLLLPSVLLMCDGLPTFPVSLLRPRVFVLQKYWRRVNASGQPQQQPVLMRRPNGSSFLILHQTNPLSDLSRVRFISKEDSEENRESYSTNDQNIPSAGHNQRPNRVFGNGVSTGLSDHKPHSQPQNFRPTQSIQTVRPGSTAQIKPLEYKPQPPQNSRPIQSTQTIRPGSTAQTTPLENKPYSPQQNSRPTHSIQTLRPGSTVQTRPGTNGESSFSVQDTSSTTRGTPENQRRTPTVGPKIPSRFEFTELNSGRPGTGTRDEIHNQRRTETKTNVNDASFGVQQPTKTTTEKPTIIFPNQPIKPMHFSHDITKPIIPSSPTVHGDTKPGIFGGVKDVQDNISGPGFIGRPIQGQRNTTGPIGKLDGHTDRNPLCYLKPDPGPCRAALPRYFLDPKTGTCNCFLYGGCREDSLEESPGSFFTLKECQRECQPPSTEEGPVCKEIFKDDHFISFLHPLPQTSQNSHGSDHLSDEQFLATLV